MITVLKNFLKDLGPSVFTFMSVVCVSVSVSVHSLCHSFDLTTLSIQSLGNLFYIMSFSLLCNQNTIKGCENVENNLIILRNYLIVRFLTSLTV